MSKVRRAFTVDVRIRLPLANGSDCSEPPAPAKHGAVVVAGIETPDAGNLSWRSSTFRLAAALTPPLAYLTQSDCFFPSERGGKRLLRLQNHDRRREEVGRGASEAADLAIWNESARRSQGTGAPRSVGRMLARRPPLTLLDEPFTALDGP